MAGWRLRTGRLPTGASEETERLLEPGVPGVPDLVAPGGWEEGADSLRTGRRLARSYAVVGYPGEVDPGWLDGIYAFSGDLRVSSFIEPLPVEQSVRALTQQMKYHQAALLYDVRRGRVSDPYLQAALEDAKRLRDALARGECRLFRFFLGLTVLAASREELEERCGFLERELASKLLLFRRCTFDQLRAFQATLPLGSTAALRGRNLDTQALSSVFPFVTGELTHDRGEIWGINRHNSSLVLLDRFSFLTPHTVTIAASGAGKSYWLKAILTQARFQGMGGIVIDPSAGEYRRWCERLGGQYVRLGVGGQDVINPLAITFPADLRRLSERERRPVTEKVDYVKQLLEVMAEGLHSGEKAACDAVIYGLYGDFGIADSWDGVQCPSDGRPPRQLPSVWRPQLREMPTLTDLQKRLAANRETRRLAEKLAPFVSGSLDIFNGRTNLDLREELVVFDIHRLVVNHPPLAPTAYFILMEFVWQRLRGMRRRHFVAVDEAHFLLQHAQTASFLEFLYRAARKLGCGLSLITQSPEEFLNLPAARVCLQNASLTLLMRQQSRAAVDGLRSLFKLSHREADFLSQAARGEGLLLAGNRRVALRVVVPPELHRLITTDPAEADDGEEVRPDPEEGARE